ncbi:MAG: glycosyltransferase family 2 protein [Candidatus Moraniibacteriota bacterium]
MPNVAILVLNYNAGPLLAEAVRSLGSQTHTEKALYILDSASTDGSFQAVQREFPSHTYLPLAKNRGFASGINVGLAKAFADGAQFAWLFNPDAEADPRTLATLLETAQKHPETGLFSPIIADPEGRIWYAGGRIRFWRMRTEHHQKLSSKESFETAFMTGCALLISRTLWERIGGLDERFFLYYEDADYSLRAIRAGFSLRVVPAARVLHREQSEQSPQKVYFLVLSGLLFFQKYAETRLQKTFFRARVTIRRMKNRLDLALRRPRASWVARAYGDFFQHADVRDLPHLR